MKKIFAILTVALVATMFVSCNKDAKNAMTVHMGDKTWEAKDVYADASLVESTDRLVVVGSEDYTNDDMPYVHGVVGATAGKTYGLSDACLFTYIEDIADIAEDGAYNWRATSCTQEITDIDVNAKTINALSTQVMKNQTTGEADVDMKVNMNEVTWVELPGLAKRMGK